MTLYINGTPGTYLDTRESVVTVESLVSEFASLQHVQSVVDAQRAVDRLSEEEFADLTFLLREARGRNVRPLPGRDCSHELRRAINLMYNRNQGSRFRAFEGLYMRAPQAVQVAFLDREGLV